jgi:phosphoribosylglycinamide formyltransferase-1
MGGGVAVMASGSGTNLQALIDHPTVGPQVALVVSDRADAGALDRAGERDIEAVHLDPTAFSSREAHDEALVTLLRSREIRLVCLAGYMRILSPVAVRAFFGRIVNVHPSLLPAFPGAHAVRDTLKWGVKLTGCTVHLVDEQVDHGPILAQEAVPVLDGDDEETLHARIQEAEHRLYPATVQALLADRIRVRGRRVVGAARIRG